MSDDLCYLNARDAIAAFKARKLSPVELLQAQIERALKVEPIINAFSYDRFEVAMDQARAAEKAYARSDDSLGPLTGIPVALKNETSMQGENTTQGSLLYEDNVDETTHPMVERLLRAGAIIHARTNVPEFSCTVFTDTRLHGTTRNPWNLEFTPGGSSGGSGATLAAGTSTLATGSDIAGSIRIPASFCGVVGLKPSYGRVPEPDPLYSLDVYNHNGPLARSVDDCALMFDTIVGPHPHDAASLRPKLDVPACFGDIKGWKIALCYDLGFYQVHAEVVENTRRVAEALRELGAQVEEIELPWTEDLGQAAMAHLGFLMGSEIAEALESSRGLLTPYAIEFGEHALTVGPADFLRATRTAGAQYKPLGDVLERNRALLCPTVACLGWPAEGLRPALAPLFRDFMTWPFNLMSRCPVLCIPSGFASNRVPTGVQIVGRSYDDLAVLQIGSNLERLLGWSKHRPSELD